MNKTCFHYACLLTWKEKQDHCPSCYGPLYYEEVPQVIDTAPYEAPAPAAAAAGASAEEGEEEENEVEVFD